MCSTSVSFSVIQNFLLTAVLISVSERMALRRQLKKTNFHLISLAPAHHEGSAINNLLITTRSQQHPAWRHGRQSKMNVHLFLAAFCLHRNCTCTHRVGVFCHCIWQDFVWDEQNQE